MLNVGSHLIKCSTSGCVLWALFAMILPFVVGGCGRKPTGDFEFIDQYLTTWDNFAQGNDELAPTIKKNFERFSTELAAALGRADPRAPSRVVFYAVVQVGGFIPLDSELGKAFHQWAGDAVPIFTSDKDGKKYFFAGDLYFWWQKHKSEYPKYPRYDEWSQREFTRNVALKLYESASKNQK